MSYWGKNHLLDDVGEFWINLSDMFERMMVIDSLMYALYVRSFTSVYIY